MFKIFWIKYHLKVSITKIIKFLKYFKALIPKKIHPLNYLTQRTIAKANGRIVSGPFRGMQYIDQAYCSSICPKLVGTYEMEIREVILQLLKEHFDAFIDIGSAEGYYTIGFAKYGNCKKVISFECSEEARQLQFELAKLNKVEKKIDLLGQCECEQLQSEINQNDKNLILCDIEGYEYALLDLEKIPELKNCTMVIECHNHVWDKMENALCTRFSNTHQAFSFPAKLDGNPHDYPFANLYYKMMPRKYKNFPILDQRASETSWIYLKPLRLN